MNHSECIFIVDDDDGHAHLVESNLRKSGITNPIQRFVAGDDVLDHIYEDPANVSRPLLMLLDLNMPGTDGIDVLGEIRGHDDTLSLPVIILTTTDAPPEVERAYRLGCNLYVKKPVQYDEFVAQVGKLGLVIQLIEAPRGPQNGLEPRTARLIRTEPRRDATDGAD